jgi:flagellar M-ring protein FliF
VRWLAHLSNRWKSLPKTLRLITSILTVGVILLVVLALVLAHQPRATLFATPLHPEQLAEAEEQLAGWNVPFTPTADNIIVDSGRRNDLLLRLSLAGVPHQHHESTNEALANVGVLTPQTVIDAQTRAGLAGDIEAGLRGINGIDDARVIVAPAQPSEFADQSARGASASVRLRLRSGTELSRDAIAGVRAFVAGSVTDLSPTHVTILDDRGVALKENGSGDSDAAELARSLQSALDSAFGEGATIVRVHAEYEGQQISERDLRQAPLGEQAIVHTARSESYDGGGRRYRHLEENEGRGSETRELLTQAQSGGLKRLSTAVFVDEARAVDLSKVRDLAAATVGYDPNRGDKLAVEAIDFYHTPPEPKDVWWLLYGAIVPVAPAVILVIGLVVTTRLAIPTFVSLLHSLIERTAVERASKAAVDFPPARVRGMLADEPPHAAAAIISALPAATATAVLELYPPHEREAIVRRMQRPHSPILDDAEELLQRRA